MKYFCTFALAVFFSSFIFAQVNEHVVFLKDKNNNPYSITNPSAFLTQRALDRRAKSGITVDFKDLPVTPSYVTQIAATGASVVYPLRWFNAVVIRTNDPGILETIRNLSFVDHVDQVYMDAPGQKTEKSGIKMEQSVLPVNITSPVVKSITRTDGAFNYGQAYNQAHMIAVDGLHDMGYSGQGMMIAVLDAGFYHVDQIAAFDSLFANNQILGTRDFSIPGNNVYGDDMHTHGTSVLSTMGANLPGEMVGTAPHASFWLVRTEVGDPGYEYPVEEYNWAAGAEFADSIGADIINSSLGYTTFENPVYNHTYADMDGNTTPVTRAADLAASRGILVVNSAGNEGGSAWQYIGAPADGDSVFSIGAVNSAGAYASFSSTGPTSDGRTKPDVTAQGQGTTVVSGYGWVTQGSGTSFSSPVTAGALACLWQSTITFSAQDIRNAVRNTASKSTTPDQQYGWGIPNLMNARLYLGTPEKTMSELNIFRLLNNPFQGSPILLNKSVHTENTAIEIVTMTGQLVGSSTVSLYPGDVYTLAAFDNLPAGLYFIRIKTGAGQQVIKGTKI